MFSSFDLGVTPLTAVRSFCAARIVASVARDFCYGSSMEMTAPALDVGFTPRLCCKTRKLQRQEFFAKTRSGRRSPIRIPSVAVPKSPVSLTREDQSPHVFTRKTRLQPAEFLITCAKRLLQYNQG